MIIIAPHWCVRYLGQRGDVFQGIDDLVAPPHLQYVVVPLGRVGVLALHWGAVKTRTGPIREREEASDVRQEGRRGRDGR
jgi:hypothetical protein